MSQEKYVSGYCRQMDASRLVELEIEKGTVPEADCSYGDCSFQPGCPIAKEIDALIKE